MFLSKSRQQGTAALQRKGTHKSGSDAQSARQPGSTAGVWSAPLHIECSGCRVIGGTKLDAMPSGERLSSMPIIMFTHLLTADADVITESTDHRVPTQRMASS